MILIKVKEKIGTVKFFRGINLSNRVRFREEIFYLEESKDLRKEREVSIRFKELFQENSIRI